MRAANISLIPGLWECAYTWHFRDQPVDLWEPSLWLFIANGVTGVRDMGSDWDVLRAWRERIEAGSVIGRHSPPEPYHCGSTG